MPIPIEAAVAEIDALCQSLADPLRVKKYARYFREGYDAYGVDHRSPSWESHRDEWFNRWGKQGVSELLRLGQALFATGKYEHGAVAIDLVRRMRDNLGPRALPGLAGWLEEVGNWAHCDVICGELIAPRIAEGALRPSHLKRWALSPHRFVRRALPVSLLGALKGEFDSAELLTLVRPLMSDQERVVHQGTGWFLRELWKLRPGPVEAYLLEWKDTAPRLIYQYATEKMTPAAKARFRSAPERKGAPSRRVRSAN